MLVDSHCHLDFPDFASDLDDVMRRAQMAGVGLCLTIGTHLSRAAQVIALAERFPNVYCTVGIHPHEAGREAKATVEGLKELARHPKVVGFGETGLDYFYEHSPRSAQKDSFRIHLRAAHETGLPVVIHTRDADADMADILREEHNATPFTGLIHCFSSGPDLAQVGLDLRLYISLSGIVTFKSAEELRRTVRGLPADRLLVETDAPYLAPMPHRGKRNEPAFVAQTAAKVADLLGLDAGRFAQQTTDNFLRLFSKVKAPCA